jgi:PAS domain-containing protein
MPARQDRGADITARSEVVALVTADERGCIVEFNPAAEVMFRRPRASVVGQPLREVLLPERYRGIPLGELSQVGDGAPDDLSDGLPGNLPGGASNGPGRRLQLQALRANGVESPVEMVV